MCLYDTILLSTNYGKMPDFSIKNLTASFTDDFFADAAISVIVLGFFIVILYKGAHNWWELDGLFFFDNWCGLLGFSNYVV